MYKKVKRAQIVKKRVVNKSVSFKKEAEVEKEQRKTKEVELKIYAWKRIKTEIETKTVIRVIEVVIYEWYYLDSTDSMASWGISYSSNSLR